MATLRTALSCWRPWAEVDWCTLLLKLARCYPSSLFPSNTHSWLRAPHKANFLFLLFLPGPWPRGEAGLGESCRICGQTAWSWQPPGNSRALSLASSPFETPGHLQKIPLQSKSIPAITDGAGEEVRIPEQVWGGISFLERSVLHKMGDNTLHWLQEEGVKESRSQENDSGACLFLYLLL